MSLHTYVYSMMFITHVIVSVNKFIILQKYYFNIYPLCILRSYPKFWKFSYLTKKVVLNIDIRATSKKALLLFKIPIPKTNDFDSNLWSSFLSTCTHLYF